MPRLNFWTLVTVLTWLMLIVLLFVPVGSVLLSSLYDKSGNLTLDNYVAFFTTPRFGRAFVNTLVVGFGGLCGALLLGLDHMALCVSRFQITGGRLISLLAILALVSPPFIGAYSWIVLRGGGRCPCRVPSHRHRTAADLRPRRDPHRLFVQVLSVRLPDGFGGIEQRQSLP